MRSGDVYKIRIRFFVTSTKALSLSELGVFSLNLSFSLMKCLQCHMDASQLDMLLGNLKKLGGQGFSSCLLPFYPFAGFYSLHTAVTLQGFDTRLIDMNRTCKVTKGGQVVKYTAMAACGNYNGVIGFTKAKGPAVQLPFEVYGSLPSESQLAEWEFACISKIQLFHKEFCWQQLPSIVLLPKILYTDDIIQSMPHDAHPMGVLVNSMSVLSFFHPDANPALRVYLWSARTTTGMKAGKIVESIFHLAGLKNVKSKVIGSRNPHNTVKAVFKALNAIETPRDVQEKFGRTVVEKYLL
ncbi:hypothetical protein Fmac_026970 [Flemingia macrophylla]|uniref:S5 DRBM domain-containing protein n=1 Tax=Flemingia macrophylla TaxID=520843 RepID=A0ABD1LGI1_9FABA